MVLLNAAKSFAEKKKRTIPVVKIPKNVKEAINITAASENGIFKLEPANGRALFDRCYVFEDVNYVTQDDNKKTSVLLQVMSWLKMMNTQFKITCANEYLSVKQYLKEVYMPLEDQKDRPLSQGMDQWINEKLSDGVRDVNKVLYLTVTCSAHDFDEAAQHFATLDTSLTRIFSLLGSRLYVLSGVQRLDALCRMLHPENTLKRTTPSPNSDQWKNGILPPSIEVHKDYMLLGDHIYVRVLFGHDYDQTLNDEKTLHALLELAYPMYVTVDMEPVDRTTLKNKLNSALVNNDRAIAQERSRRVKQGQYAVETSYYLDRKKDELVELLDQVDSNDEQAVFIGLLVAVAADNLEELDRRSESLKEAAKANGYLLSSYHYRQLKALNTALPIGGRQVDCMRSFLTSSAVAFNPFYARDLKDAGGYVYGLNRTTKHLIRGNRKRLKNPHGFIAGHSGGGKSFYIKETEVAQTLLCTSDDVMILDPQNEFEDTVLSEGGQYFDLTPQGSIHLNPFDVPDEVRLGDDLAKNTFIARKTEYACAFVGAAMYNITMTQVHNTFVSRAVQNMYADFFDAGKKSAPTFKTLWDLLKQAREESDTENEKILISDMIHSLEPYVIGVYDMFAQASDLNIHNRLVGFGLKNVPTSIWEPVMVTMMHFLSERVSYNQGALVATHLIVDEAQVLCERPSSASQLLYAVETYRKFGGIVTLVVQNLVRALETPDLRDMFSNCAYKVFFDQGGVDAKSLAQIQEFSESEYRCLEENIPGQGVMVWDTQVLLFDASMDRKNPLYGQFSTNFHEQALSLNTQEAIKKLIELVYVNPVKMEEAMNFLKMDRDRFSLLVRTAVQKNHLAISADGCLTLPGGKPDED